MSDVGAGKLTEALAEFERQNYSAALKLLQPLANAGNPKAMCSLACLYHLGLGVQPDVRKAIELYLSVAAQSIREECLSGLAYSNLAAIYAGGALGVDPDIGLSREYRRLAKELGFPM